VSRQKRSAQPESQDGLTKPGPAAANAGPFGWLPRVSHRHVGLEQRIERWTRKGGLPPPLAWLRDEIGIPIVIDRPEILWRASGLGRASLVAQMSAPRLATRLGVGVETPLAHTIVDRLLGFDRAFAESRLQLTPVEWGVWTFLFLRALDSFDREGNPDSREKSVAPRGPFPGEFTLDRVGPDAFDLATLGPIVTVRWAVRVGTVAGAVRLWLPEAVVGLWLAAKPALSSGLVGPVDLDPAIDGSRRVPRGELGSWWCALAGTVSMPQGLRRLRVGGVLPLTDSPLKGTPASPSGEVDLVLDLDGQDTRFRIPILPVADSGGRLVRLDAGPLCEPRPRNPIIVSESEIKRMTQPEASSASQSAAAPLDVPVTLTVELGRVNVTLTQLADLKPGDVIELNRHSKAAVELTSNGRLVARGELILIDTDLGVRVTNVFL
jgi:flagellar motor switch protein FliN